MFLYLYHNDSKGNPKVKQKVFKMTVPKELQDKWKSLYSTGDFQAIAEKSGFTHETIRTSFNKGECSDKVFEAIADYYKGKDQRVNQYLTHQS